MREAIEHFERAVALDPRYARPWAGLARAYLSVPFFPASWLTQSESFSRAERAARRAVEVDDQSAEAHAALGDVFAQGYWRWSDAEREMRRALTLDPDLADAHAGLSSLLAARGRDEEALAEAMRALALEPTEAGMHLLVTGVLGALGRTAEARAEARRTAHSPRLKRRWNCVRRRPGRSCGSRACGKCWGQSRGTRHSSRGWGSASRRVLNGTG